MVINKITDAVPVPRGVGPVRPVTPVVKQRRPRSEDNPFGIIDRVTISQTARRMYRQSQAHPQHSAPIQVYERPAQRLPSPPQKILEYKPQAKLPK